MGGILGIIIAPLALAVVGAYLLAPPVRYLERQGLGRMASIFILYLFLATLLVILCLFLYPTLLRELREFSAALPEYAERFSAFVERAEEEYRRFQLPEGIRKTIDENIAEMQRSLANNIEKIYEYGLAFLSRAFALLLVPLFTFYFLRDNDLIRSRFLKMFPLIYRDNMERALSDINVMLGGYLRGLVIVSAAVGVLVYLGLLVLGVNFALLLGVLNGLSNIIPYFGPLLGAVPAVLVALLQEPALAGKVILLIVIVQQVESQFIAPQVLGRSLGFHPLVVIIALLFGGLVGGFWGLILIVPFLAVLTIVFRHFYPTLRQAYKDHREQRPRRR